MTSLRQIEANRRNARASTGPKSREGKARSACNARRHGLAVPILSEPGMSAEIERLARELVGPNPSSKEWAAATSVAEAHLEIVRVRQARRVLISPALTNLAYWPLKPSREPLSQKVTKHLDGSPTTKKLTFMIADIANTFKAMDRYERRSLSRRKFAIRNLDHCKS
jgi:hypothetical protein